MVAEVSRPAFCQPVWRPSSRPATAKESNRRPRSAQSTRVNPWLLAEAAQKAAHNQLRRPELAKTSPAAFKTPWPPAGAEEKPAHFAARLQADSLRSCDSSAAACGAFVTLAQPAELNPDSTRASVTDARLDLLQRMIQNKFENNCGGHVLVPAFRRLSHASREDDPRRRRAHPRDLARFLGDCGAHATDAEAAQILVNARAGAGSADGKFGIRTFHDLARGTSAARAASSGCGQERVPRDSGRKMTPARAHSASRSADRSASQMHRDDSRPRASCCERTPCVGKVGSNHWSGSRYV